MTESQEPESNDELEEEDGQLLTDGHARSVLPPPGAAVPLGPDELPPIKPA
jgi:hypothetical protein